MAKVHGESRALVHPEPDPIETALAKAIELAAAAEQWETVQTLSRELGERRRARVAPEVTSLGDMRALKR